MAEKNQVKWVGIQPIQPIENLQVSLGKFETTVAGVTRAQVTKSANVANGAAVLYTVTAGKTLYLVNAFLAHSGAAASGARMEVRNGADTTQYSIIDLTHSGACHHASEQVFPVPLVLPAGWDIYFIASPGTAYAFIHGWEE